MDKKEKEVKQNIKEYLKGLVKKWDSYDEYGGRDALSFMNDIEMLLEYWDLRIEDNKQEIDRAREEGYTKGVQDGMKGKVFEKIEIDTEVRFSDLKDVIDGKEDAGEFLSKLTK